MLWLAGGRLRETLETRQIEKSHGNKSCPQRRSVNLAQGNSWRNRGKILKGYRENPNRQRYLSWWSGTLRQELCWLWGHVSWCKLGDEAEWLALRASCWQASTVLKLMHNSIEYHAEQILSARAWSLGYGALTGWTVSLSVLGVVDFYSTVLSDWTQSLFYLVPQENLTAKQDWLGAVDLVRFPDPL